MSLSDVRTAPNPTSHDRVVLGSAGRRKQGLSELMFVRPLAGLLLKRGKNAFVTATTEGLLDTVFAVNLRDDLYGTCSALVMLPPDKHATKVAICRGTPKSKFESAPHATVGPVLVRGPKMCGKQDRLVHPERGLL